MTSRALKQRALLSARRRCWALLAAAMALAIAGYYGAWTPHKAAGLVVIGLDLAEYVKFLPPVASGQIALRREVFYLPLFVASITAGLIAGRRTAPPALRVVAGLAAIPLALAMLPPAWSPAVLAAERVSAADDRDRGLPADAGCRERDALICPIGWC